MRSASRRFCASTPRSRRERAIVDARVGDSGTIFRGMTISPNALTRLAFVALAALAPALAPRCALAQQPASSRPTLVVFFTIDQMRPDHLSRFDRQLTGGLARLYRQGAVFENAYQDHAITETAPGHSATLSGRFPRSTGITTNSAGVQDDRAPLLN